MRILTLSTALALTSSSLQAHHFFAPEYERDIRGTIEGVVIEVAFVNPHVTVAVSVAGEDGEERIWRANTVGPNGVRVRGWEADTVKVGDRIVVEGFLGRDGAERVWIQSLRLPSGLVLYPVGREGTRRVE